MLKDIVSNFIPPVRTSNTGHEVLGMMEDAKVSHLPIVNNEEYLGLISEYDIFNNQIDEPIGTYSLSLSNCFIDINEHVFDAIRIFCEQKLTLLPVVNKKIYVGYIELPQLVRYIGDKLSINTPGSIIEIELNQNDYYLSKIIQIVEANDAKVLHCSINTIPNSTKMILTLKLDRIDNTSIIQALNRYEYNIVGTYGVDDDRDILMERYELLMKYLNI